MLSTLFLHFVVSWINIIIKLSKCLSNIRVIFMKRTCTIIKTSHSKMIFKIFHEFKTAIKYVIQITMSNYNLEAKIEIKILFIIKQVCISNKVIKSVQSISNTSVVEMRKGRKILPNSGQFKAF